MEELMGLRSKGVAYKSSNTNTAEVEKQDLFHSDGKWLVPKSGPENPTLEDITPHQWSAANARILFQ